MSLTLKPYPKYKESGLASIGSVPSHWSKLRAKYLFREVDERSVTGQEELLSVSHITGVTPRSQKNVTMFMAESNVGHKVCRKNDLVINTMWAWMGALGVTKYVGLVSPSYGVYRPSGQQVLSDYLDNLLRTRPYVDEYTCRSTGINSSRLRLYPDRFLEIPILVPPSDEQRQIVSFIRFVRSASSKLIRAKRRMIELLDEEKRAMIQRALTCGVNPDVRVKPSGVEWLGDVPEHWGIRRLKWVTRLQRGYDLPSDQRRPGVIPVVSSGGVIGTHCEARAEAPGVVMGRYGSTEAVFYMEQAFWPHNTSLFVTDFQGNDRRWCFYLLRAISKVDLGAKSAVPGVDRKDLYQICVAVPPVDEQSTLVVRIENELDRIEKTTSSIQQQIGLFREYRSRLIADVVTGKLDVRGVELPEMEGAEEPLIDIADEELEDSEELVAADGGADAD